MDKNRNRKTIKENNEEVEVMAVSIKPSPILKGEVAKKLLADLEKIPKNKELFKMSKEMSNIFTKR